MRGALEEADKRFTQLETEVATLKGHISTLLAEMNALKQSNNLALQQLRGTGATANGNHD